MFSDFELVSLSIKTGQRSVSIGCANMQRTLKLLERFSAIISRADKNWFAPLNEEASQMSSIAASDWIMGVERRRERISGLMFRSKRTVTP